MTDRIKKLRDQSLNAVNCLSAERALLVTNFYKSGIDGKVSVPVMRALNLNNILVNKFICINEDELIAGERGPAPKATPTYPEINLHSLEYLAILDTREKVSFKVDEETKRIYREEIIPFWKGKNNRDRIMKSMTPDWMNAYDSGIFTEFQEQRAPGHTVCGNIHAVWCNCRRRLPVQSDQRLEFCRRRRDVGSGSYPEIMALVEEKTS